MLKILQVVLIVLFGCVLIVFPIAYRLMDRTRFHCQMCIRQIDRDLLRWIEAAAPLMSLDEGDGETPAEYERLASAYRSTKKHRTAEKVRLVNGIYDLARLTAVRCSDDVRAQKICAELRYIYAEFSVLADDYNDNIEKLNAQLDGAVGGFFGKIFFIPHGPVLEKLSDLKA